jgi:hypothetical protein
MRVTSTVERLDVPPGGSGVVPLEVVNTSEVIDSLSVAAVGVPDVRVRSEPAGLALFPQAAGELAVTVTLPRQFPAGTYPVTFVVAGQAPPVREAYHDVDLVVPAHPHLRLAATPSVVRTRGQAEFRLSVTNDGNVPLDVALRAVDADRTIRTVISPATLSVPPGGVGASTVLVKGPRQLLGSERDRPVRVLAQVTGAEAAADLVLRQRSAISQGLLTVLVLFAIVAVWATVFLLGTTRVLGTDPFTKVAPPSFFAAIDSVALSAGGLTAADPAPAGALPKEGPMPAGVGGQLAGTVRGAVDGQGIGRITVVAMRDSPDGPVVVSSAASQADGTYVLAGLFPGPYQLRVDDEGYEPVWYPDAASRSAAGTVVAAAGRAVDGVDITLTGRNATLQGTVDRGDAVGDVTVQVTARPTWPGADPAQQRTTTADAAGGYSFTALPAPGTYELTFSAEGYQPTTLTERVLGGQERFALDVRLGAGTGSIAGVVTDGSAPLGGVTVGTTVDGEKVEVGTPTVGPVGTFVIPNLPTPATYVVTVAKAGFGSRTLVVDLGPGELRSDLRVELRGGVGTVTGTVVDEQNRGLGGVTVTAGGTQAGLTTTTLTSGAVGTFTLTGVTDPGSVTLAFSRDGYAPESTAVTVSAAGTAEPVRVVLRSDRGSVTGRVTSQGAGRAGVVVTATDGAQPRTTTSTTTGARGAGTYLLPDLPAGTYTVTATLVDTVVATAVVEVRGGQPTVANLPIGGG